MSAAVVVIVYVSVALVASVVVSIAAAQEGAVAVEHAAVGMFMGFCWPVLAPFVVLAVAMAWIGRRIQELMSEGVSDV